ncbi:MAG: hypothetical protein QXK88_00740 [Desulfurococcaceae archaeon]
MSINKVIVEVQLDFSEESDRALKTLFNVAEELLDKYELWVEIIPVHLWFSDPLEAELSDLPKIFINGKLRFIGKSPSRREALNAILEHANTPPKRVETASNTINSRIDFDGGIPEVALTF